MTAHELQDAMHDEPWRDFVHTGPGTLAGRYLRMFWQPIGRSQDLAAGHPEPIHIMGDSFTLFRGESGTPYLVDFRCAHRGTQLSVGWVEGESIRCRYHGWRYDGSGQCVEQPGEDPAFASKICIRSYPCEEYLGLVFAYLGEGSPPPMRRFVDFENGFLLDATTPQIWRCNYFNRVENDPSHVPFTHRESARRRGNTAQRMVRRVQSEETEFGVHSAVEIEDGPPQYIDFHMPNINQVKAPERRNVDGNPNDDGFRKDGRSLSVNSLFWRVPIDDESCISFAVELIPVTGEAAEAYRRQQQKVQSDPLDEGANWSWSDGIINGTRGSLEDVDVELSAAKLFWMEDYVTQVGQGAIPDRSQEHLVHVADESVILKRQIWQRELRALSQGRPLKQWAEAATARA